MKKHGLFSTALQAFKSDPVKYKVSLPILCYGQELINGE